SYCNKRHNEELYFVNIQKRCKSTLKLLFLNHHIFIVNFIMLLTIHPDNPQPRLINQVVETLRNGGVIIYPTDTIYGLGCDIFQPKAVERICRIKGIDPGKAQLSFICHD